MHLDLDLLGDKVEKDFHILFGSLLFRLNFGEQTCILQQKRKSDDGGGGEGNKEGEEKEVERQRWGGREGEKTLPDKQMRQLQGFVKPDY